MPALKPDQIIGNYRIVRRIGVGGMGAVYEARHTVLNHRAALKVMHSDGELDSTMYQRFLNEARAAGQIEHPGIVKVFDFGTIEEDGSSWLAMEYLEGETLSARLRRQLKQTGHGLGTDSLWIPSEIASVLSTVHAQGIIHRDLKPPNVMLVPDPVAPSGERVRVLDFGIAKLHSDQHTRRGTLLGTPAYMAMEQLIDSAVVDGKADVFSLGVMFYELLAGRLPHLSGQPEVMLGKRILEVITPIQQLVPSLPPQLGELIMAMLSQEATGRPTMAAVDTELRRARGLPPARPSGFYQAVVEENAASLPSQTIDNPSGQRLATPSAEKMSGEISPAPVHLLARPSKPPLLVDPAAPPLRAGPLDRTEAGAPTPLPMGASALPSAPTQSSGPGRRVWYLLGAVLTVSAALTVVVALRTNQPSQRTTQPVRSPSAGVLTASPSVGASVGDRSAPVAPPQAAPVPPPTNPTPAAGTTDAAPDKPGKKTAQVSTGSASHRPGDPKSTPSSSARPRCPAVEFTEDCVKGKGISPEVRRNVLLALRDRPMRMCASDRLVIGMSTEGVRLVETPDRLSDTAKQDFLLTLRGYLDVTPRAGKIEIQCPERQP